MQKSVPKLFLASLLVAIALASTSHCPKGHIKLKNECIPCKNLENVNIDYVDSLTEADSCPCIQGYSWSSALQGCLALRASGRSIKAYIDETSLDQ